MAQQFNSRKNEDDNSITVPDLGLVTNAPVGGYPAGALLTLTNLQPNKRGQLSSRRGTDALVYPFEDVLGPSSTYHIESYRLGTGSNLIFVRADNDLVVYHQTEAGEPLRKVNEYTGLWPLRCLQTKLTSTQVGNKIFLACRLMLPLVLRIEEKVLRPTSTTWAVPDPDGRWRYHIPKLEYEDGEVVNATVSWSAGVATFTIPVGELNTNILVFNTFWHWACGGKLYYGNQLYREQLRFNVAATDVVVDTPSSLLTNQTIAPSSWYPFVLGRPARRTYYTHGTTDAATAGSSTTYRWTSGTYLFDGASSLTPPTSQAVAFGALEAGGLPSTLRYYRLVEVNSRVSEMAVLVQAFEGAPFSLYTCSASISGSTALADATYVPFQDNTVPALGDTTTTVYKYIAFDGEPTAGLGKEAVVWVLTRPDILKTVEFPGTYLMVYSPYQNGTLFPMPGVTDYMDSYNGAASITQYDGRVAMTGFPSYSAVVQCSQFVGNRSAPLGINMYASEYGIERLSTDPFLIEVSLERGEFITAIVPFLQNLLVFSNSHTWRMHGEQGATATALRQQVDRLFAIGALNARCVDAEGAEVVVLSKGGAYSIFYRDQSYQLANIGLQIADAFYFTGSFFTSWVRTNPETNVVYVGCNNKRTYGYDRDTQMWYRIEHGRKSEHLYASKVVDDRLIWPGILDESPLDAKYTILSEESTRGYYMDYAYTIVSTGAQYYDTNLTILEEGSTGTLSEDELTFYLTPYGVQDIRGGGTPKKTRHPPSITVSIPFQKALSSPIIQYPVGVFWNNRPALYSVEYTVDTIYGNTYRVTFLGSPPAPGELLTFGYTYPQVVESAPATRGSLLRSKLTKVACVAVGPAPDSIESPTLQVSANPRSSKYLAVQRPTEIEFKEDREIQVHSATLNVDSMFPSLFVWNDFSASGFVFDSYQFLVENNERRSAGGI